MKNLIVTKSKLVLSICVAAMLLMASSCKEDNNLDSREAAEKENKEKLRNQNRNNVVVDKDNDTQFLMDAAELQLEKISLGKLAQQKGNSPHVKELGKMMEKDHTKSFNDLKALAQSKNVSIPTTITKKSKDTYHKLEEKTGNDFGIAYSSKMVDRHEDAIDLFEKASNNSEDPEIREWASQQLPTLRAHLKHSEACKRECERMKT